MLSYLGMLDFSPLTPAAEALYRDIVASGGTYALAGTSLEGDAACKELYDCGLLGLTDPTAQDAQFTAIDPGLAKERWQAHLRSQAQAEYDAMQTAGMDFDRLAAGFDELAATHNLHDGYEIVHGVREINARLVQLVTTATVEVLTLQPGPRPADMVRNVTDRDRLTAQRLTWRTLYETSVRSDPGMRDYAEILTAEGAAFRTVDRLVDRLMIFDRKVAIVAAPSPPGVLAACFVTAGPVVGYLRNVFESIWHCARPFGTPTPLPRIPEPLEALAELLRAGLDQKEIGERLGLKQRTCSAQIAELKRHYDATTLFQLGKALAEADA